MRKISIIFFVVILSSARMLVYAEQKISCDLGPVFARTSLRHIESNGIGYNTGYSTLDLFVAPGKDFHSWLPFLDARMHVFNNGQPALNAGLGLRYKTSSWVYGLNSYYDYRKTHRLHYNQLGLGFEALSKKWDIRANGYIPVGKLKSKNFQLQFSHFQDHFAMLSSKKEFAMYGAHLESGYHIKDREKMSLYAALGPYCFYNEGKNAAGGQARINASFYDYLKIEVSGSYDPVFKWIGQGQAGIMISFGSKSKKTVKEQTPCYRQNVITERSLQNVDREEIVVLDRKKYKTIAKDPSTGDSWYFYFVNNTSSSLGSAESPYPTLAQAQNASKPGDIIYVYSGSGAAYDVGPSGFALQENQKLWGSATDQDLSTTLGDVIIAAQSLVMPTLTGGGSDVSIVNLSNKNDVAGIHFNGNGVCDSGILGGNSNLSVVDANIHNNYFDGEYQDAVVKIFGKNRTTVYENTIQAILPSSAAGINITSQGEDTLYSKVFSNNVDINGGDSVGILSNNSSQHTSNVGFNTLVSINQAGDSQGISITSSQFSYLNVFVNSNTAQVSSADNAWGILCGINDSSAMNAQIKDNDVTVIGNGASGYTFAVDQASSFIARVRTNQMNVVGQNNWSYGMYVQNNSGGAPASACNAIFEGNIGTVSGDATNKFAFFINSPFVTTQVNNNITVK
jgi:hypothetical protein